MPTRQSLEEIFGNSQEQKPLTSQPQQRQSLEEIFGNSSPAPSSDFSKSSQKRQSLEEIFGNSSDESYSSSQTQMPAVQKKTFMDYLKGGGELSKKFLDTVTEGAKGVAKGALDSAKNTSELVSKIPEPVMDTFKSAIPNPVSPVKAAMTVIPKISPAISKAEDALDLERGTLTTPTNTAQKVGYSGEKIAEFMLPGSAAKGAGTAVQGSRLLKNAPNIIKKVAPYVAEGVAEAGITTAQTAAQQGKLDKEALIAGAVSGVASPSLSGASKVLDNAGSSLWSSILRRTQKEIERNPNLERQIAKTGMFGSKKSILNQAKNTIQETELQLDDLLSKSTESIDSKNIIPYLDELKTSYSKIPGETESVKAIQALQDDLATRGTLTPKEANILKREIYSKISRSYGKGTLEVPAKVEAQKQMARGLKEEIEKIVPEVKNINERQGIYLQVQKAIERQLNKPKNGIAGTGIGFSDLLLGGVATAGSGGDWETGAKVVLGKKLFESARVRSGISKVINYYNNLSPTKKALFYNALKGSTIFNYKESSKKSSE